jgi:hypothetical protein
MANVMLSFLIIALVSAVVFADMSVFFNGAYTDPNHPDCPRAILPLDWNSMAGGAYTDGSDNIAGEGVSCKNAPPADVVTWGPLPTAINGTAITIDFSSKGGPANLHGDWKQGTDTDGTPFYRIQWEDGNYWDQIQPTR